MAGIFDHGCKTGVVVLRSFLFFAFFYTLSCLYIADKSAPCAFRLPSIV